jgi:alkylation response protein AidB-like acyl-CoA dehydrogenase
VGEVGDGWRVVITTFMFERTGALFGGIGVVDALLQLVKDLGKGSDRRVRDQAARLYATEQVLIFTARRMLTAISQGRPPGPEGSLGKLVGSLMLTDVYDLALELLGAAGMLAGPDAAAGGEWQAGFLGAPGLRIGGGTDEIQRNIIAERILGLPADPRPDKELPFRQVARSTG